MATISNTVGRYQGTSIKFKLPIRQQLIILLNTLTQQVKFPYHIHIFTTIPYDRLFQDLLETVYGCHIHVVKPDVDHPTTRFFCWSRLFTTDLGGEYTHRIKLDTDMFFVKPLELDFDRDILMTYMPSQNINSHILNLFIKSDIIGRATLKRAAELDQSGKGDDLMTYQYENGLDYTQFYPYFNGGFVAIREGLCSAFGARSLDVYTKYFKIVDALRKRRLPTIRSSAGMFLQDALGFIAMELTDNWASTPIGVNYYGEWDQVKMDTRKYLDVISLVHYLGYTTPQTYAEFGLYQSGFEYRNAVISHKELSSSLRDAIIALKNTFWEYPYESQVEWFDKYVRDEDQHFTIFHFTRLVGYALLREITDGESDKRHRIIDTVIVDEKYRGQGLGGDLLQQMGDASRNPRFPQSPLLQQGEAGGAKEGCCPEVLRAYATQLQRDGSSKGLPGVFPLRKKQQHVSEEGAMGEPRFPHQYLLCEPKNTEFYEKFGFSLTRQVEFIDKEVGDLVVMSRQSKRGHAAPLGPPATFSKRGHATPLGPPATFSKRGHAAPLGPPATFSSGEAGGLWGSRSGTTCPPVKLNYYHPN